MSSDPNLFDPTALPEPRFVRAPAASPASPAARTARPDAADPTALPEPGGLPTPPQVPASQPDASPQPDASVGPDPVEAHLDAPRSPQQLDRPDQAPLPDPVSEEAESEEAESEEAESEEAEPEEEEVDDGETVDDGVTIEGALDQGEPSDSFLFDTVQDATRLPAAPRRSRAPLVAVGLLAVIAVVAGGVVYSRTASTPAPAAPVVAAGPISVEDIGYAGAVVDPAGAAETPDVADAPAAPDAAGTASTRATDAARQVPTVADARCPRHGSASLGYWELPEGRTASVGDTLKVKRDSPVRSGSVRSGQARLGAESRCRLDRRQRVEVRTPPVPTAEGTVAVEVFPTAISGG